MTEYSWVNFTLVEKIAPKLILFKCLAVALGFGLLIGCAGSHIKEVEHETEGCVNELVIGKEYNLLPITQWYGVGLDKLILIAGVMPNGYQHWEQTVVNNFWMHPEDFKALLNKGEQGETVPLEHGFFTAKVTPSITYDRNVDLFEDEFGLTDLTMSNAMESQGFEKVAIERYNIRGYPVLFVQADYRNKKPRVMYLATKDEGNVLVITYTQPQFWTGRDTKNWQAFRKGVLDSNQLCD